MRVHVRGVTTLDGTRALITGATSGLGRAMAGALASEEPETAATSVRDPDATTLAPAVPVSRYK